MLAIRENHSELAAEGLIEDLLWAAMLVIHQGI